MIYQCFASSVLRHTPMHTPGLFGSGSMGLKSLAFLLRSNSKIAVNCRLGILMFEASRPRLDVWCAARTGPLPSRAPLPDSARLCSDVLQCCAMLTQLRASLATGPPLSSR